MTAIRCCSVLAAATLFATLAWAAEEERRKPPIRGLVSMGAFTFVGRGGDPVNTLEPLNAKAGIFGGLVVISTWRQLEPERGAAIPEHNPIDQALAEVHQYNERNPHKPIAVRLRVWGGFEAPEWAKALGGPPIKIEHNHSHRTRGRFWSPEYRQAWCGFQDKFAAKYESYPPIREVSMPSCMSLTAEPFFSPSEASVQEPDPHGGAPQLDRGRRLGLA